ncbi:phosphopantothenoylcysteine decarboxylase / phosphopantothenate--cysteine ligase [Lentzea jiangxiensis]|uniref:Phosphopantothenoylcysteine decarboxylase / phosphopantothenate--cysteine ligase n=2 Tax=Lentzea jiangxiensis TaxID=641025 RepID=A0A1H0X7Q9_9PSEU|nr:phosphopantothenoylcysteine decarboxylase / phosphopantothenate--cysteine ligase [Lentzea jiangxiensis]
MSRGEVYTNRDEIMKVWRPGHIELADWAEVAVVVPATAAVIGKLANGIAEGLLCETFLAFRPEVRKVIAPAMNGHMLHQPSVQRNIDSLKEDGYVVISTREGELACGYAGDGKLAAVHDVVNQVKKLRQ